MLKTAIRLERLTIAWTLLAGLIGSILGTVSRSVSLTAFGLDGIVEFICALVLLRRLEKQLAGVSFSEVDERNASRLVGALLLFAALYVTVNALVNLTLRLLPELSGVGIALTLLTVPIMVPLANAKLRIARTIRSRALRADAIGNAVCWYLAVIVLTSLVARMLFQIWWLDGVASLMVVGILLFEGIQAWRVDDAS